MKPEQSMKIANKTLKQTLIELVEMQSNKGEVSEKSDLLRPILVKKTLSNGIAVFDFEEEEIMAKMESLIELLNRAL